MLSIGRQTEPIASSSHSLSWLMLRPMVSATQTLPNWCDGCSRLPLTLVSLSRNRSAGPEVFLPTFKSDNKMWLCAHNGALQRCYNHATKVRVWSLVVCVCVCTLRMLRDPLGAMLATCVIAQEQRLQKYVFYSIPFLCFFSP